MENDGGEVSSTLAVIRKGRKNILTKGVRIELMKDLRSTSGGSDSHNLNVQDTAFNSRITSGNC